MAEGSAFLRSTKSEPPPPQDPSIVNYESKYERDCSAQQILWSKIMEAGNYRNPSTYTRVEVLLLCWAENASDFSTREEVNKLKSVFEERFRYSTHLKELDYADQGSLQVLVNAIVARFVLDCDGTNTLLIVYYAGHGRPARFYGGLELFGQTSPNDTKKRTDSLVWNKTEDLLKPAKADVLEIFDCCYAGSLGLTRGEQRLFEYLAATGSMGTTKVPGVDSFTSALTYALETLVEEKSEGRFTTIELLGRIKHRCPHFPKDQMPVLSNREENAPTSRIMLHPLHRGDSNASNAISAPDPFKETTLTLHFDFAEEPSNEHIMVLGEGLNFNSESHNLRLNGIRWGGTQNKAARYARPFVASLKRRRASSQRQQAFTNFKTSHEGQVPRTPEHHGRPRLSLPGSDSIVNDDAIIITPTSTQSSCSPLTQDFVANKEAHDTLSTSLQIPHSPPTLDISATSGVILVAPNLHLSAYPPI